MTTPTPDPVPPPPPPTPSVDNFMALAAAVGVESPARPGPVEAGSWKAGGPVSPRAGAGVCRWPVSAVAAGGRSGGASPAPGAATQPPKPVLPRPPGPPTFPPPGEGVLYDALPGWSR